MCGCRNRSRCGCRSGCGNRSGCGCGCEGRRNECCERGLGRREERSPREIALDRAIRELHEGDCRERHNSRGCCSRSCCR